MIRAIASNIISPLGMDTEQNYLAVRAGRSALSVHSNWKGIPAPFVAAAFPEDVTDALKVEGFTRFESLAIRSIEEALCHVDGKLPPERTLLILSTTKCNVEELSLYEGSAYSAPGETARRVAGYFGFVMEPIVVCNACISGVTAQVLADRMLQNNECDFAVVCGADCLSAFTIAGFMSFKSLSPEPCRPFDIERLGLNLGEAAATIVYARPDNDLVQESRWTLVSSCLNNDAYHVSSPSPTGDGVLHAIRNTLSAVLAGNLALVNAHGTATMFNDQMESKAIERAGLSDVPVSALKGYFGHTLGAAGVLETIITMRSLDDGMILPVKGFEEIGVSGKMNICKTAMAAESDTFLKIISGFGACNGAAVFTKIGCEPAEIHPLPEVRTLHSVRITPEGIVLDGKALEVSGTGKAMLTNAYRDYSSDYPKFHKMDMLSKLVFLASELLCGAEPVATLDENTAVILFNRTSSVISDRAHIETINGRDGFFPSPSVFLYTLPNIANAEVTIRHGIKGETSLFILAGKDERLMEKIISTSFLNPGTRMMISGWVDCPSEDEFEADMKILTI